MMQLHEPESRCGMVFTWVDSPAGFFAGSLFPHASWVFLASRLFCDWNLFLSVLFWSDNVATSYVFILVNIIYDNANAKKWVYQPPQEMEVGWHCGLVCHFFFLEVTLSVASLSRVLLLKPFILFPHLSTRVHIYASTRNRPCRSAFLSYPKCLWLMYSCPPCSTTEDANTSRINNILSWINFYVFFLIII